VVVIGEHEFEGDTAVGDGGARKESFIGLGVPFLGNEYSSKSRSFRGKLTAEPDLLLRGLVILERKINDDLYPLK